MVQVPLLITSMDPLGVGLAATKYIGIIHEGSTSTRTMAMAMRTSSLAPRTRPRGSFRVRSLMTDATPSRPKRPSFAHVMGFAGTAPELLHGRLAMVGFTASAVLESRTGMTVASLFDQMHSAVVWTTTLCVLATLVPLSYDATPQRNPFGVFRATAETLNGRLAMLGFVLLVAIEAKTGVPFFVSG